MARPLPLVHLVLPTGLVLAAWGRALGPASVDMTWSTWRMWSAGRGQVFHSGLIGYPEGVDLLASAGGWVDVLLGGPACAALGPLWAYNLVAGVLLALAGLGGHALARELGASRWAAVLAGLVLQLDGFLLDHLVGGRLEHACLGVMALALAGALRAWRRPGWGAAAGCGLAGGLVVWCGFEQAVVLAAAVAFLAPWIGGRSPGAWRRWGAAAALCAAVAAPLVWLFLSSPAATGSLHTPDFARAMALEASVGALGWLGADTARPGWLALVALALLPWTARREDRRLWVAVGVGLALALALALGPSPGLWNPTSVPLDPYLGPSEVVPPAAVPWAPFALAQHLPVVGRIHWPERLLSVLSLAAAPAVALAVDQVARWRSAVAVAAVAVVAGAVGEAALAGRLPVGRFQLRVPRHTRVIGEAPGAGAVLDLPVHRHPPRHMDYHLAQMVHGRPMLLSMQLHHLGGRAVLLDEDPILAWFEALTRRELPAPRVWTLEDFSGLRAAGYRFVVLHHLDIPAPAWDLAEASFRGLGEPWLRQRDDWRAWDLDPRPGRGPRPRRPGR